MHASIDKSIHEILELSMDIRIIGAAKSGSEADKVRHYVQIQYIEPAKRRGEKSFTVVAGDVHRALGFNNRVPLVCTALRLHRFHEANRMVLSEVSGPPSKLSTTVRFTFSFLPADASQASIETHPFWKLRGLMKGVFPPGEWEESIRRDRQEFADILDKNRQ